MKIKAVFFDVDGTLRDYKSGRIPDSAKQALKRAKEAGLLLFVATGRHFLEIDEENLLEGLYFDGYVTLNGQYCVCGDRVVHRTPIDREQVETVLSLLEKEPFPCIFMEAGKMYINLIDKNVVESQEGIGTSLPPVMDVRMAAGRDIYQMIPYVTPDREKQIMERLKGCEAVRWHDGLAFDLVPAGKSKWDGILAVLEDFGCRVDETAVIGDGKNDVTMISRAGCGIAMGNACSEAKAAADYVTLPIEEGGIAAAIEYLLKIE